MKSRIFILQNVENVVEHRQKMDMEFTCGDYKVYYIFSVYMCIFFFFPAVSAAPSAVFLSLFITSYSIYYKMINF